jgi:Tfp pilus assembly protein PilF
MESAAKLEDGTEKSVVTPGPLSPARELLGEMLLEMNNPAKALVQFEETLKKEPRRFRSLYGAAHAAQLSGRSDLESKVFWRTADSLRALRQAWKTRNQGSA